MTRTVLAVTALVLAVMVGWQVRGWYDGAAQSAALNDALSRASEREIQIQAMHATVAMEAAKYEQERAQNDAAADASRAALERLQRALAAADGTIGASRTACGSNGRAVERTILGDCAAEYQRVAHEADRLRARLVTLQAWALAVTQGR